VNARERFLETLKFGKPDRPFLLPQWFFEETIERWQSEGLPPDVDVREFFGFDRYEVIPVSVGLFPPFKVQIIEETSEKRILIDSDGVRKEEKKPYPSMPKFLEFPVRDQASWERIKSRLNPDSPARYPRWWEDMKRCWKDRDYPLGVNAGSFYGWPRNWMGVESFSYLLYDDPELVSDICGYLAGFIVKVIARAVEEVDLDFALIWEDLGFKTGPLISPELFERFMLPAYKKVTSFLKEHGIDIILVDSDGMCDLIIPHWIEGGVTGLYPFEVAAGSDAVATRERYGEKLSIIGNIDKRVLARGKKEIEEEVMSKVPPLFSTGGYIPFVDHCVPPDVPFENFCYYLELIKELGGGNVKR
jgi:hypothetical protein